MAINPNKDNATDLINKEIDALKKDVEDLKKESENAIILAKNAIKELAIVKKEMQRLITRMNSNEADVRYLRSKR